MMPTLTGSGRCRNTFEWDTLTKKKGALRRCHRRSTTTVPEFTEPFGYAQTAAEIRDVEMCRWCAAWWKRQRTETA